VIFADSNYFIALWDDRDDCHASAVTIERKLREIGWARGLADMMTCLPMACEIAEHISYTLGPLKGSEAFGRVMNNCRVVRPTERDVQLALDRTFRIYASLPRKRRRPGMVDSVGVAIMRRTNVLRIVSFDSGFDLIPDIRRITLIGEGAEVALSADR
jgi:predicted nucleic acid-binding protein